jgi:hypothetical protein
MRMAMSEVMVLWSLDEIVRSRPLTFFCTVAECRNEQSHRELGYVSRKCVTFDDSLEISSVPSVERLSSDLVLDSYLPVNAFSLKRTGRDIMLGVDDAVLFFEFALRAPIAYSILPVLTYPNDR